MKLTPQVVKNFCKYLCCRVFILYLAAFALTALFFDYKAAKWHAQAATLSRLQPPYDYLAQFSDAKVSFDRKQLQAYRLFFTQLLSVLPGRPDGYAMLGFCHYQLGDIHKSVAAYQKAADAVPSFLWFNYDLGFLYFQTKDYQRAAEYLSRAVTSNPDAIVKFMASSKVYLDAIGAVPNFQQQLPERLRTTVRDSYKIMVLSYFHLQQYDRLVAVAQMAVDQKLDDDGFFFYYLGVGAFYANRFDRSIAYLQESLKKNPDAQESYYYLALVLKALNKEDMAVASLQKSQSIGKSKGLSFSELKGVNLRIF